MSLGAEMRFLSQGLKHSLQRSCLNRNCGKEPLLSICVRKKVADSRTELEVLMIRWSTGLRSPVSHCAT